MQQMDYSKGQVRRFLRYLKDYKLEFSVAIIGMIGYSALDTYVVAHLKTLIDDSLSNNDSEFLKIAAYAIVPLFILRGIFNFMGTYTLGWIGAKVVMRMRQQLFEKYLHLPVAFHDTQAVGTLISKVTYDTEQVANAAGKAFLTLVREGALVIGLLGVMFYYSWQLSLIFLLIGPVVAVIVTIVSKRFRKVSRSIQQSMGTVTAAVEQAVKGHKVILMFGGQGIEQSRFERKNNHNRQQNMKLQVTQILSVSSIQVIASIALAFVLYMASLPSMMEDLTAGTFVSVVFYMVMLLKPLKQLTTVNNEFQKGMAACTSIFEILDEAPEENTGNKRLDRAHGSIKFDHVTFTYPNKSSPALTDICFSAEPGQTIALVGRSGSGKSTISSLLTRFYSPQAGTITVDGIPLSEIELTSLRKQFALVSQHVVLFNDTIANNIAYGANQDVSPKEIEDAAAMAHVTEFVEQLPEGLDTVIGENGLMLSGGQRQRIAIARAILANAPILILDEATSALDTESERLIQDALETLQKSCTSLVVAHRLSTIEKADQIMVVEQGRIIERGKHEELLTNNGPYSQLHALQFGENQ
ncbi:lipid A export permease/ATP-binding protein MsbA [Salinimonas sp. HHU 13199]|uniref:Lipid A export permease/ATP-binding protein MsbA n=1 Tax=Salinimonas profundi TaxID=2729140 RepID=A0ABR8LE87_9ALTE|nr:lipid A export permease/ATP-binding protein MsbA [Salinimonas profundi]MBD3584605.1 lipid A export permease/ATP-binding protein MsbA [Salinimonas profundi]